MGHMWAVNEILAAAFVVALCAGALWLVYIALWYYINTDA